MKSILVTGANGGMGKAVTGLFAKYGYRVFALDRDLPAEGENIVPIQADVTDEKSLIDAVNRVGCLTQELYAILHLAGIYLLNSLIEITPSEMEKIFRVNLGGAFLVNRLFRPFLTEGARIMMITSELAVRDPLPFTGVYAITKAALDRYAYSLKMELQLSDIYVSVLRAGAVDTGMLGQSTDQLDSFCEKTKQYQYNAKRFRNIVDKVEARKISPDRIAKKVYKITCSRIPAFAYSINRNPLLILFDCLPVTIRFWVIRKILENPASRKSAENGKCLHKKDDL